MKRFSLRFAKTKKNVSEKGGRSAQGTTICNVVSFLGQKYARRKRFYRYTDRYAHTEPLSTWKFGFIIYILYNRSKQERKYKKNQIYSNMQMNVCVCLCIMRIVCVCVYDEMSRDCLSFWAIYDSFFSLSLSISFSPKHIGNAELVITMVALTWYSNANKIVFLVEKEFAFDEFSEKTALLFAAIRTRNASHTKRQSRREEKECFVFLCRICGSLNFYAVTWFRHASKLS